MTDNITYNLDGADEILDALSALDPKIIMQIIKSVERKALMENIVKPVRAAIPYSTRTKKGIGIANDKQDKTALLAGPLNTVFYLRFVEKGTKERTTARGASRGAITARPIVIPTVMGQIDDVVDFFNKDFGEAVDQILQKKIKKINK